ncbi:MAG: hypothetical protein M1834_002628 [Cirrosporium novae-zelandiae]|nr:MAG: hypothetical protein M1834_002628 [Cirrosporium novae-zelandiae]
MGSNPAFRSTRRQRAGWQPALVIPAGYSRDVMIRECFPSPLFITTAGMLRDMKLLAYNDMPPHGFSFQIDECFERLLCIQKNWDRELPNGVIENAFWEACLERHHRPFIFTKRDKYLALVVEEDVELARKKIGPEFRKEGREAWAFIREFEYDRRGRIIIIKDGMRRCEKS